MFYSQCLLSKKGPLGTIWVAAHCLKRLKKEQVAQTNISSSVDKILLDEVPVVTYRILGYLLLGVVRIYSKKVEYLFHDCRDVLTGICRFAVNKKSKTPMEAMTVPYSSITLPERFELDAFDLEVLEDASGGHMKPREEIMLEGRNEVVEHQPFDKYQCEETDRKFETYSTSCTPVKDIRSPRVRENDMVRSPCNSSNSVRSMGKLRRNRFSLEERLDPLVLSKTEEAGLVRPTHSSSNLDESMEKLRGNRFSLEECLDPLVLSETEEAGLVRPSDKENHRDGEQMKCLFEVIIREDRENQENIVSVDDDNHIDGEQELENAQSNSKSRPVPIVVDVKPKPKVPNASGIPLDFESFILRNKLETPEAETVPATAKTDEPGSPTIYRSPNDLEQAAIAPSTPVAQSASLRFQNNDGGNNSVGRSMEDSIEKELSTRDDLELDMSLMNEVLGTGGYVDVKQGNSYDDILVRETFKLKQSLLQYLGMSVLLDCVISNATVAAVLISKLAKTCQISTTIYQELLLTRVARFYGDIKDFPSIALYKIKIKVCKISITPKQVKFRVGENWAIAVWVGHLFRNCKEDPIRSPWRSDVNIKLFKAGYSHRDDLTI
ncbi:hypothetical protein RJ640_028093 [Escallonia rubra]|uniref:Rad21/Rec8-like protein N-terminal domain-containing protein n=1 Tax=Escallonia rubra TaxID=112253 RepID=A0AA88QHB5_9ASTE|nr:hypothetical protein RJ640_028093 [Escallonia rubra]